MNIGANGMRGRRKLKLVPGEGHLDHFPEQTDQLGQHGRTTNDDPVWATTENLHKDIVDVDSQPVRKESGLHKVVSDESVKGPK